MGLKTLSSSLLHVREDPSSVRVFSCIVLEISSLLACCEPSQDVAGLEYLLTKFFSFVGGMSCFQGVTMFCKYRETLYRRLTFFCRVGKGPFYCGVGRGPFFSQSCASRCLQTANGFSRCGVDRRHLW